MNKAKRILALLLCLCMVLSYVPMHGHAAGGAPNVTISLPKTEVAAGDVIDVWLGINETNASSIAFGFDFDNTLLQVTGISAKGNALLTYSGEDDFGDPYTVSVPATSVSTKDEANASGHVGCVWASDTEVTYSANAQVVRIRFKALKAGTIEFTMFEDSAGTDGCKTTWTFPSAPEEPECTHEETKLVPNDNGTTHNVVCDAEGCGEVVTENVTCTGTDDGDHTTAVTCACGNVVTAGTDHVDSNPKDHVCDNGCDVFQGTHADGDDANHTCDYCGGAVDGESCVDENPKDHICDECGGNVGTHADSDDNDHLCDYCNGTVDGETHTEGEPVKNTEESKDATCTEGGTLVEDIFCTECGEYIRSIETPVPANPCTTGTVDYTWGTGYATCKAQLICEHGTVLKEEEVTTTNAVTTEGNCVVHEVVTYYADFTNFEDTSKPVTGEKNPNVHYSDGNVGYYKDNGDGTHSFICGPCGQVVEGKTGDHDKNGTVYNPGNCRYPTVIACSDCKAVITYSTVPNVHAANATTCVDNKDGATHTRKWPCCDAVVDAQEEHTYVNGVCDCTAKQKYTFWVIDSDSSCTVEVEHGANIQALLDAHKAAYPAHFEKTGHTLTGWKVYTNPEFNDEYTGETVTGSLYAVAQWEVNYYTLTLGYNNDMGEYQTKGIQVPFGTKLSELAEVLALPETFVVDNTATGDLEEILAYIGTFELGGWAGGTNGALGTLTGEKFQSLTMPAMDYHLSANYYFTGWYNFYGSGWQYWNNHIAQTAGWIQIDGAWYYLKPIVDLYGNEIFVRAEGLTRVPYPTDAINGITYAPDADALAYCASKGETFIDETEAWFVFGDDGKFNQTTGLIGTDKYAVDGMLAWHPGLVLIGEDYYYFIGDMTKGGNISANGDTYITKNNGVEAFAINDVYNFVNGELSGAHGIVDGKYYENSKLMLGNGLTKVGDNYIYVRYNGELVVGAEYYIPVNTLGVVSGMYSFDENGYMIEPEMTDKNGIVNVDGVLYYYENGKIAYNKGLIEYNGEIIYVKSNGQLATGNYYVTNVPENHASGVKSGDRVTFDENGYMVEAKNGIVAENGSLYYYVNNVLAYNAGVIEIDGNYYYVKSNGELVHGRSYWISNVGDSKVIAKKYTFDDNGVMQNPEFEGEVLNGIHNGYYYIDGKIAYCAGLLQLVDEEGKTFYIYVRSNGQLATGIYWPTTTNGFDFSGRYDFGPDGKLYT